MYYEAIIAPTAALGVSVRRDDRACVFGRTSMSICYPRPLLVCDDSLLKNIFKIAEESQ
jgi:hypothetical protein